MYPSCTRQRAGTFGLSAERHSLSDRPSKSTIASDGGGTDAVNGPGSTTRGCGREVEWIGQVMLDWPSADRATAAIAAAPIIWTITPERMASPRQGVSTHEAEYQAEQHEARDLESAVDQPEREFASGEGVVQSER